MLVDTEYDFGKETERITELANNIMLLWTEYTNVFFI